MTAENLVWILPRPRRDHYKGGFPLGFEEKLLRLYGFDQYKRKDLKKFVIQLFSGMCKYGFKVDINPGLNPDYVGDVHNLPEEWTNKWEMVICDPPYNDKLSNNLYQTDKIRYYKYISEAVRITKPGGFIVLYHWLITPRPKGTTLHRRIFIGIRTWHRPRVCCIFQKKSDKIIKKGLEKYT